jgi:hypothetical protein
MHIPKWQEISGCYSALTTTNARELIKRVINSHGIIIVPFAGWPLKSHVLANLVSVPCMAQCYSEFPTNSAMNLI